MPTTLDLAYPFSGRWLTQNSPANRIPSHGTTRYASAFAIDFVGVDEAGRSALITAVSLFVPEPPTPFVEFGWPVLAPADGVIVVVHDEEPDHAAVRSVVCHPSDTPSPRPARPKQAGPLLPATT